MITSINGIDDLLQQRPEWAPWLTVVGAALAELGTIEAGTTITRVRNIDPHEAPLLERAKLELDGESAHRVFGKVLACASRSGNPNMVGVHASAEGLDVVGVMEAALNRDKDRLTQYAREARADPDAFGALAAVASMPVLHACNRRFASEVPETWARGYCPVCGGGAAFAEVRGVERSRYLRCADCGGEWQSQYLQCHSCGNSDHEKLGSLVSAEDGASASIETCSVCYGYLKVFTTLRGARPDHVILHDLATAELDIAAAERGFRRGQSKAYVLHVNVATRERTH